jgi:hypothetical protein
LTIWLLLISVSVFETAADVPIKLMELKGAPAASDRPLMILPTIELLSLPVVTPVLIETTLLFAFASSRRFRNGIVRGIVDKSNRRPEARAPNRQRISSRIETVDRDRHRRIRNRATPVALLPEIRRPTSPPPRLDRHRKASAKIDVCNSSGFGGEI